MITRSTGVLRDVLTTATTECRLRGDALLGNEHLLLALLHDPTLAPLWGERTADEGRRVLSAIDAEALRSVGVEPVDLPVAAVPGIERHLDLSHGAKSTLETAQRTAKARRSRKMEARDILQALLLVGGPDVVRELIERLGIDPTKLLNELTA
ncbi:Clp protease N-terminal domain-containing protein [Blastococcus sp. Marseille-P5729]|uniref:Clp protease N-terminal domain-containing protein n=1 Tax=Blastococcus sp. Marseille-P5729 TaxID=2086582 RepID=UPI00131AA2B9|nr:Clp protease N-terminal domain-containing protein [Blastococcus sp. Marseille-P5729]